MGALPIFASNELVNEEKPTYVVSRLVGTARVQTDDPEPKQVEDVPRYVVEQIQEDETSGGIASDHREPS